MHRDVYSLQEEKDTNVIMLYLNWLVLLRSMISLHELNGIINSENI